MKNEAENKTDVDKFLKYNGYKFFKYNEDNTVEVIRIIELKESSKKFKVKNEETGDIKTMSYDILREEYTPLEPRGFIMFINVWLTTQDGQKTDDIIIAAYDMNHLKIFSDQIPYVVCRQSVNDVFYNAITTNPDAEVVGCCISKDTIPANMQMSELLMCSGVYFSQIVNYYIEDTIDSILECLDTRPFNDLLEKLFKEHMRLKNINNPLFSFKNCKLIKHDGWCRNLKTLLHENNFITDLDVMRNIQALDFDLSEYIRSASKDSEPDYLDEEVVIWLSRTYRIPIKKAYIMKYDHDIDLADFNESTYMLFRDNTDTTYLVVYVIEGQFLEAELEERYNQISPSDKIRLAFYNKYQGYPRESFRDISK